MRESKYCWYEQSPQWLRVSELVVCIGALCYWIFAAIRAIRWDWPWVICCIFYLAIGYWISVCVLCAVLKTRKYCITSKGIQLQYWGGISREYDWDEFSEISICKVRFNTKNTQNYHVAIRCVIGQESSGPQNAKSAFEKWTTEVYDAKHWRSIITIEYSENRFAEFTKLCPLKIADYRHLANPS